MSGRRLVGWAALLAGLVALGGCVYYPAGYGPYYGYPYYGYAPAYPFSTPGTAPAATDYNPVSGSRTGSH